MTTDSESRAAEIAGWIADRFDECGLPYAIGGALALSVWTTPRTTVDVDVSVFVGPDRLDEVLDAIERGGGLVDRQDARRRVDRAGLFAAQVMGIRVDVFLATHPLHDRFLARRRSVDHRDTPRYFLSPEDIAIAKLIYHRPKDLPDLESLFAGRPDLDTTYIRSWLVDIVGADDARLETLSALERRFIPPG